METSSTEIANVTITRLLHFDVFCRLLLRMKCMPEEGSFGEIRKSLVQLS
jgi:hypothetical protein